MYIIYFTALPIHFGRAFLLSEKYVISNTNRSRDMGKLQKGRNLYKIKNPVGITTGTVHAAA